MCRNSRETPSAPREVCKKRKQTGVRGSQLKKGWVLLLPTIKSLFNEPVVSVIWVGPTSGFTSGEHWANEGEQGLGYQ